MKRLSPVLLLIAASCGVSDPREDAVLFDSAEERANRDLLAFYYLESKEGGVASVVVPRNGPSVSRLEIPKEFVDALRRAGVHVKRRIEGGGPVDSAQRDAIEGYFAGLPSGPSERALPTDGEMAWEGEFKGTPETERIASSKPFSAKVRILHMSKIGEIKTLTIFKAPLKDLPAGIQAGGAALETLDKLFGWLGRSSGIEFDAAAAMRGALRSNPK